MYRSNHFVSHGEDRAEFGQNSHSVKDQHAVNRASLPDASSDRPFSQERLGQTLPQERPHDHFPQQQRAPYHSAERAGLAGAQNGLTQAFAETRRDLPEITRPSVFDEQIGDLFKVMGRASKMSRAQLAQRFSTSEHLIEALEQGALDRLPEWDEVARVTTDYTRFMNIDERPVLRRLREKLTEYYLTNMTQEGEKVRETCEAIMPLSSVSLKAFAHGQPPLEQTPPASVNMTHVPAANLGDLPPVPPAVGHRAEPPHQAYRQPQQTSRGHYDHGVVPVAMKSSNDNKKSPLWLRLVANFAFVAVLLVGFIQWQPNRFWSGVDQLPKPVSKTIYSLFEYVVPDPLASTYRMNWVYVDDPRMRKTDRLPVPKVKKLPAIDFSALGDLTP